MADYQSLNIANNIKEIAQQKNIVIKDMLADLGLGTNTMSNMRHGRMIAADSLAKIADYLGVAVDQLLDREEAKTDGDYSDVKVALFGGDGEVTDEMWEEVKQFADYVKAKYLKEKK